MTLEESINKKITDAIPYFELLPAVTIIHNIKTGAPVYMSSLGLKVLNTSIAELQSMGPDYYAIFFNPDEVSEYVPTIFGLLERNNNEEMVSFFQQVKAREDAEWSLWLSSIKIFMHDEEGQPLLTVVTTIPVAPEHNFSTKLARLLNENNFLHRHNHLYASLTKREKEILQLMAQDKTASEIATLLFLSEDTVKTHRRNIKRKIKAENHYEVVRFAQAFNVI